MSKEAMKLALEALEPLVRRAAPYGELDWLNGCKAITALREALAEQPAQQCKWPTCQSEEYQQALAEQIKRELVGEQPAQQKPVNLRRGDLLRCIETDELCTVWATSTTGKTLIKWSANNFGDYTAEQIGELFWLEPAQQDSGLTNRYTAPQPAQQEPYCYTYTENGEEYFAPPTAYVPENATPLYTSPPAQRTWVGLTDREIDDLYCEHHDEYGCQLSATGYERAIEAKLREKNA